MTLYETLKQAGIETDNHASDLYFPKTEQTTEILARFPEYHKNATTFTNQLGGGTWYDVPFAYDLYKS